MVSCGGLWQVVARQARRVQAYRGTLGEDRHGEAGLDRHGKARLIKARQDISRQDTTTSYVIRVGAYVVF